MSTPFVTRVDRRPIGQELFISGEAHTIPISSPYLVHLTEVPNLIVPTEDVVISGFTRVTGAPAPGQFLVNFSTGDITFNSSDNGASISVAYYGLGSELDASDINEMHAPINNLETEVDNARGSQPNLVSRLNVTQNSDGTLVNGVVKPATISTNVSDNFEFPNNVTVDGNLIVTGSITDSNVVALSRYTDATEATLVSGFGPSDGGKIWFNTDTSQCKIWNGTAVSILG